MKNGIAALTTVLVAFAVVSAWGYDAPDQRPEAKADQPKESHDKASLWMKHKLSASQKILEGMTREDFEMVTKNAKDMHVLGYLEKALRAGVPGYRSQLRAFDDSLDLMIRCAEEKNLDGVTIAYAQLAISCVQCHQVIREKPTQ